ncbi:MAG TPA: SRPBCC family protein [Candidatus Thermoplasmatota archaeon]|nr:SRPBCC family protein [Candidatus Thermoplasmatota archaeon]
MDDKAFFVDPAVERAHALPAAAFTDPAFLDRELATTFARHWSLIPLRATMDQRDDPRSLAEMVRTRGARAPVSLVDRPFFLQRDWDGGLHLFPNVCTHAWHTLVPGPGRERTVRCPQHGREFDCLGNFVHQPGFEQVDGFPTPADDLAELGAAEWGDLLFATLGRPAHALDAVLAPVRASIGRIDISAMRRAPLAGEVRELDGNWKQHAWNYMDQLHIPYIHKKPGGLADAVDLASYRTELHGLASLQWAYAKDPAHGFEPGILDARFETPGKRVFALWWLVFPNLTLNFYPWGLSINLYMPVPGRPQRTLFHWYHLVSDAAKYARRDEVWMMQEVDDEDVDALTQVARGVRSGFAPRGRFAPGAERGPHWFHRLVYEGVFG